jgi:hypothetical protein
MVAGVMLCSPASEMYGVSRIACRTPLRRITRLPRNRNRAVRGVNHGPEIEDRHFAHYCPDAPEELKKSARERLAKHRAPS